MSSPANTGTPPGDTGSWIALSNLTTVTETLLRVAGVIAGFAVAANFPGFVRGAHHVGFPYASLGLLAGTWVLVGIALLRARHEHVRGLRVKLGTIGGISAVALVIAVGFLVQGIVVVR